MREADIWPVGNQNSTVTVEIELFSDLAMQTTRSRELRRRHQDHVVQRMIA